MNFLADEIHLKPSKLELHHNVHIYRIYKAQSRPAFSTL